MGKNKEYIQKKSVSLRTVITDVITNYFYDKPFTSQQVAKIVVKNKEYPYSHKSVTSAMSIYFKNTNRGSHIRLVREKFYDKNFRNNVFVYVYALKDNKKMLKPGSKFMKELVKESLPGVNGARTTKTIDSERLESIKRIKTLFSDFLTCLESIEEFERTKNT